MGILKLAITIIGCFMYPTAGSMLSSEYLEAFVVEGVCFGGQTCSPTDCEYEGPIRPNVYYGGHAGCDCHFHCLYHGTCCLNYEEVCLSGSRRQWLHSTHPHQTAIHQLAELADGGISTKSSLDIDKFMHLRQSVVTVDLVDFYRSQLPLVMRCPDCGNDKQCNELKEKCESPVTSELSQLIYVSHDGAVFKNKFCAECYIPPTSSVLEAVSANILCDEELLRSDPFDMLENGNYSGIFSMINNGTCEVEYENTALERFVKPEVVSECDDSFQGADLERFSAACSSYVAYVEELPDIWADEFTDFRIFRNKHCAICNGVSLSRIMEDACYCSIFSPELPCIYMTIIPPEFFPVVPFFSIALDFGGDIKLERSSSKLCDREIQEVEIPSGECINRYCPQNATKLNTQCAVMDNIQIHKEIGDISFIVTLGFPPSSSFLQPTQTIITEFKRHFLQALGERENYIDLRVESITNQNTLELVADRVTANINLLLFKLTTNYQEIMEDITEAVDLSSMMITMNHFDLCPRGFQEKILSEFMFIYMNEERFDLRSIYSGIASFSTIFFPEFEVKLDPRHHKWTIKILKQGASWQVALDMQFCYNIDDECTDACDTVGFLCQNCTVEPLKMIEDSREISVSQDKNVWSGWEVISTLVMSIFSILALFSCLIVHRLFPDLMKKGGGAFTQLLISLLVAEVGLLVGSFQVWHPVVCSVLGAVQHFAWLASFFWTAIMSWDMFCIFVWKKRDDESSQALHMKLLVGWSAPLVIVATCAILHVLDLFTYGSDGACWIRGGLQLALSFGLPVGLIIVTNLVFYALTIRQLTKDMQSAEALGRPYDPKMRILLCCKLSAIVGFTWIFGFLANIPGLSFFKQVFAVCASLNGTMVALSFTVSSKTIRVIRSHFSAVQTATLPGSQPQQGSTSERFR